MNETLKYAGVHIPVSTEYSPEGLEQTAKRYLEVTGLDESKFASGKGHRKSVEQKLYEKLGLYKDKLCEYVEKLRICGTDRNSYSKTDHDATFMRMKRDYMGNDQLLPAYNVQVGVADEYIAVLDVQQYRLDMDCFVPLMEKFREMYGFYPKYPVADAGYGSFNNYIFCHMMGMEKYMKFPMYRKETKDAAYRDDPFRAVNFRTDEDGALRGLRVYGLQQLPICRSMQENGKEPDGAAEPGADRDARGSSPQPGQRARDPAADQPLDPGGGDLRHRQTGPGVPKNPPAGAGGGMPIFGAKQLFFHAKTGGCEKSSV